MYQPLLGVDLTRGCIESLDVAAAIRRRRIGGTGLGLYLLSQEIRPGIRATDPATAGMSGQETRESIRLIERIARERGLTLLFTEHDMEVVFAIAHRITVLHQGEVIADGTPEEVRAHPEVRRVYLGERR